MSAKQLDLGIEDPVKALCGVWDEILKRLSTKVNKPTYESFFKYTIPLAYDGATLTLGAPTQFAREWLEKKHCKLIVKCAEGLLATDLAVRVELCASPQVKKATPRKSPEKKVSKLADLFSSIPLSDRYTFDSFVVGPCNEFAHASARMVASTLDGEYNPFFIYGGTGLGKTHLMQSIGNLLAETAPDVQLAHISGETFTCHYVASVREHRTDAFRKYYRNVDIWLVDDVQYIAQKERTEEEFYHTLDLLCQIGKQVVICADQAPRDLRTMDARLRSRFESGLVADLARPDLETRIAILEKKAEMSTTRVPREVIEHIARVVDTNVRALEGAFIRLVAYSSFMRRPITLQLAADQLGIYFSDQRAKVNPRLIAEVVAARMGVDLANVLGACRQRRVVLARQIAMYLARELTDCTLDEIGAAIGGRNHATVLHARERVRGLTRSERELARTVKELHEAINGGKF